MPSSLWSTVTSYFHHPTSFAANSLNSTFAALAAGSESLVTNISSTEPIIHTTEALQHPVILESIPILNDTMVTILKKHDSHPALGHLVLLVFEAVLEVAIVSLPGYIVARSGMFDAEAQKFVANLNVMVFTPCLIFTKLASQLTAEKLADLAIIPVIFIVQTFISWVCALAISKAFRFEPRARNFVIAMGVFGNSNSLPISLVLSLSKTISGLHWDKIPGDNDNEVAARGILYLLIFQQLGQLLRWTWGYNVLLKPRDKYEEEDAHTVSEVESAERYRDDPEEDEADEHNGSTANASYESLSKAGAGVKTPVNDVERASEPGSPSSTSKQSAAPPLMPTPANGNYLPKQDREAVDRASAGESDMTSFPPLNDYSSSDTAVEGNKKPTLFRRMTHPVQKSSAAVAGFSARMYAKLPAPIRKVTDFIGYYVGRFLTGLWAFMNPPLWAMLVAILVASIPDLQRAFFEHGTFVNNSITRAVTQSGGVAVPLILTVLGANLARNTLPRESISQEDPRQERKLLIASLISRMLLPFILMAPLLALAAKYIPISILDDPIFLVVCFLLTGAPSALQLAQICQINDVYMGAMSSLLFQSYVVWILPSTLVLVTVALEVLEWAKIT